VKLQLSRDGTYRQWLFCTSDICVCRHRCPDQPHPSLFAHPKNNLQSKRTQILHVAVRDVLWGLKADNPRLARWQHTVTLHGMCHVMSLLFVM
jgi:hypothetical protein